MPDGLLFIIDTGIVVKICTVSLLDQTTKKGLPFGDSPWFFC
jgi:hypothetical protein